MPGEFKIAEAYADIRTDISKFSASLAQARAGMQATREHTDLIGRSSLRMFAGLTNAADTSARRAREADGTPTNTRAAPGRGGGAEAGFAFDVARGSGSISPSTILPPSGTREDRFIALIEKQLDEYRQQKEILRAVLNLMKKEGVVVGAVGP